jgi:hypothetical protein
MGTATLAYLSFELESNYARRLTIGIGVCAMWKLHKKCINLSIEFLRRVCRSAHPHIVVYASTGIISDYKT